MSGSSLGGVGPRVVTFGMVLAALGALMLAGIYVLWMVQTRSAVRNATMDLDRAVFVFCVAVGPGGVSGLLVSLLGALHFEDRALLRVVAPIVTAVVAAVVMGTAAGLFYEAVMGGSRSIF